LAPSIHITPDPNPIVDAQTTLSRAAVVECHPRRSKEAAQSPAPISFSESPGMTSSGTCAKLQAPEA
jgi:hypothetical protein